MNLCCEYPAVATTIRRRTHRGYVLNKFRQPQASPPLVLAPKQEQKLGIESPEGPEDDSEVFTIPDALRVIDDYERYIYPVFPIIPPAQIGEIAEKAETDRNDRALLIALYAVTIGHSRGPAATPHVSRLVQLTLQNRGVIGPDYKITLNSVMTSVLIACCLMATHNADTSWIYLREAMTMASILRLDDITTYCDLPVYERSKRHRLYWLLYVHERFLAIHSYRPVLLSPLSVLPEHDPTIPQRVYDGFLQIIKLFRLVDTNFMEAYLSKDSNVVINQKWFEETETQLAQSESGMESLSEMQQVDLIITQQWLRMLVWRMAMSRFWLSTGISEGCMSLLLPVQMARKLRTLISKCSEKSIQVHGTSILRKLFELSIAIGNVIILVPAKSLKESAERVEDYMWIANFLLRQPQFSDEQKSQLTEKLERVYSVFPDIPQVDGVHSPDDVPQSDPWLSLSRPFVAETTYENSLPLMPTLDNLSEMSQGLLNELNISV
ncbi:hypothetical protein TRVA0_034S01420 [Trichomonascus vanleenenianus]|uniref:fungal specific transcription factor domain-containing protein n=1 Tax=Trichomonascus vanleenenianus TaxID=2268995 RepID=UPI003ECA4349